MERKLTPTELGHRAAAQGDKPESSPFEPGEDLYAWTRAYNAVNAHRRLGHDPGGHEPIPPHLCTRAPQKVCNCCADCEHDFSLVGA